MLHQPHEQMAPRKRRGVCVASLALDRGRIRLSFFDPIRSPRMDDRIYVQH